MAGIFKQCTMMLMASQKADRLREEKRIREESAQMRRELRSIRRQITRDSRRLKPVLEHQDMWQEGLFSEAHNFKVELDVATSHYYKLQDKIDVAELEGHIHNNDHYLEEIRNLRLEKEELEAKLTETTHELEVVKTNISKRRIECSKTRVPSNDKVMRRLSNAVDKYGEQLEENRTKIDLIHHLCIKKALVQEIHDELQKKIRALEKAMQGHVDTTLDKYDRRDTTKRGIASLQKIYETRCKEHSQAMENYNLGIEMLRRTERFVREKNKHRYDEGVPRRIWQMSQPTPSERDNTLYRAIEKEIRDKHKEKRVLEVVHKFRELVAENFALFLNIEDIGGRTHKLIDDVAALKEKTAKQRGEIARNTSKQTALETELEEKRSFCHAKAEELKGKIDTCNQMIADYIEGVKNVLERLGYTPEEVEKLAGIYGEVEERNIQTFLKEIEKFVNKIYAMKDFLDFEAYEQERRVDRLAPMPGPRTNRFPKIRGEMTVSVPPYDQDADEDEEEAGGGGDADSRPWELQEVTDRVKEGTARSTTSLPRPTMEEISEEVPPEENTSEENTPKENAEVPEDSEAEAPPQPPPPKPAPASRRKDPDVF